ncbi:MAG: YodL domain-containing protein [Oscillospiraceae bacterium]|nr:YodL domain-containing protein [Clostridiales bacterium]MDY2718166.1 YodL domain-containing protein [Oscillospiraceae bacterium]
MAEKQSNKDRLKEITDSIENGIKELFESEKYKNYLRTMSRFHKYSVNNTMLIYMQKPDATVVAGFNKWRDQFGRNVLKGEKGIKIIAPTPYKKKIEEAKLDPDTKLPMLDADGKAIMEEKEIKIPMYKPVTVFDVSQTEGKPLPQLAADLTGNVQNYEVFMEAVKRSAPVPVFMENMTGMDGYYDDENRRIAVRTGMSEVQTVCAAIHEIAHSLLHSHSKETNGLTPSWKVVMVSEGGTKRDFSSGFKTEAEAKHFAEAENWRYLDENRFEWRLEVEEDLSAVKTAALSRNTEEVQAESISYAVCGYFGIETGENSFGYIATWSKGKELPELKASLETINRTASGLITDIDRNYKMLMKERGLDKEPESLAAEPVQEITVQEPEPVSAPDNGSVPDPAISVESMNAYGYTDSNMLPLTKERALELMERDVTVYMLHTDNTEAMAFDADEIRSFDGIFGVEASEWGTVKDRFVPQDYEKAFLDNPADSFAIYQLRDNDDTVQLHYMNSEYLEKKGLSIQKENYAAVYAGDLDRKGDTQDKLNELYETFNIRRPEVFRGHSLSVSDIVALKQNGVVSCHYVDSWGFKELPGFLKPENYLKNAEMAMEDDYGMIDGIINNGPRKTVAELEEQSKTGTPISLLELAQAVQREDAEKRRAQQPVRREKSGEKPSILAKLKTPSVADTKSVKSAPKRSAEREL